MADTGNLSPELYSGRKLLDISSDQLSETKRVSDKYLINLINTISGSGGHNFRGFVEDQSCRSGFAHAWGLHCVIYQDILQVRDILQFD